MTTTQQMMTTEESCPKCGEEMFARCEPDHEGGCFYETADDEAIERAIQFALKRHAQFKLTSKKNPLPLMLKQNKTRKEKIELLKILEDEEPVWVSAAQ